MSEKIKVTKMITINIPNTFLPERTYIINVIFGEFLELEYRILPKDTQNYEIILGDGNKLILIDSFFSHFKDGLDYLDEKNIPVEVKFLKNQFIVEEDIPVIYGNNELKINENEIICGIDIFSSSFFMLSRWEEHANKTREVHNRFPSVASLAYKNNFLDRPIVNEYIEMLWKMLTFLGCEQKQKKRKFELILTHDVDNPLKFSGWRGAKTFIINFAGDIIKRRNPFLALSTLRSFVFIKLGLEKDPFDTFDYLMDLSEKSGVKSNFYFMGGGTTEYDSCYSLKDNFIKKLMEKIDKRGHNIGFHSSYNTYNNKKQWQKEYQELSSVSPQKIKTGRQHFLRFEVPTTWQIWEDNNMTYSSTLNFPDKEGFRCGTCYEFSVFNILTREKLKLKEHPLIVMEGNFLTYQNVTPI